MIELIKKIFCGRGASQPQDTQEKKIIISIVRRSQGVAKIKKNKKKKAKTRRRDDEANSQLQSNIKIFLPAQQRIQTKVHKSTDQTQQNHQEAQNLTVSSKPPWPAL